MPSNKTLNIIDDRVRHLHFCVFHTKANLYIIPKIKYNTVLYHFDHSANENKYLKFGRCVICPESKSKVMWCQIYAARCHQIHPQCV